MRVKGIAEMHHEAARFVSLLKPLDTQATVVALSGDLGSGKTAFVKGVAKALGVEEHVTSPTFVIMKIYDLDSPPAGGFEKLVHIDAYRLKGEHHLNILGWQKLVKDPKNLILVEWPEKIAEGIRHDSLAIRFDYVDDESRNITYQ